MTRDVRPIQDISTSVTNIKDIERYGNRVYQNNVSKYYTIFIYRYNDKMYIITKSHGEVVSLLETDKVNVYL